MGRRGKVNRGEEASTGKLTNGGRKDEEKGLLGEREDGEELLIKEMRRNERGREGRMYRGVVIKEHNIMYNNDRESNAS